MPKMPSGAVNVLVFFLFIYQKDEKKINKFKKIFYNSFVHFLFAILFSKMDMRNTRKTIEIKQNNILIKNWFSQININIYDASEKSIHFR